jgi:hypothetical protein
VSRRALVAAALALAVLAAACGRGDGADALPSGALGVVTPEATREAVLGLCQLGGARDIDEAEGIFLDRSHATLHVIAAAAEMRDRASAAALLEAKERVEADLIRGELPARFRRDVRRLIDATRSAVDGIGLEAPMCPAT